MRIFRYTLLAGFTVCILGLSVAIFLEHRQLGKTIFLVGFFVSAGSIVFAIVTSAKSELGKIGGPLKISAGGFGVIVLGQLLGLLLNEGGSIGKMFFLIGLAVMVIGILASILRINRNRRGPQ